MVGAATFILSQVGHIPFNALMTLLLSKTALVNFSVQGVLVFSAIFLGLSVGFFEELFRYGMFRWWLGCVRTWRKGILARWSTAAPGHHPGWIGIVFIDPAYRCPQHGLLNCLLRGNIAYCDGTGQCLLVGDLE